MDHQVVSLEEIKVIGIEMRTSNADGQEDFPLLMNRFYSENIMDKIPNKVSEEVLWLYTEYESDYTKPFTLVICCKVKDFSDIPEGMVSKTIPASKFAVFSVTGKMPDELIKTWHYIWSSDLQRTYTGDFDLYPETPGQNKPAVSVHVAIK
ncbi:MAG: GyrI-like domain-containing protein [bacterium]|nr:GyrI-like domain-containing protein [bacterium]